MGAAINNEGVNTQFSANKITPCSFSDFHFYGVTNSLKTRQFFDIERKVFPPRQILTYICFNRPQWKRLLLLCKCVCHFHSIYLTSYILSGKHRFMTIICLLVELSICLQLQSVCLCTFSMFCKLFYIIYPFTWLQTTIISVNTWSTAVMMCKQLIEF